MTSDPRPPETPASLWIPIAGTSMWPTLRTGDLAGVQPLGRRARVGEVVVVRAGARLVAHRVVATRREGLLLRGDTCRQPDPPVAADRVLGRVVHVRRRDRVLERAEWDRPLGWLGWLLVRIAQRGRRA